MLDQNLIRMYEKSFRENAELPALTDYFKRNDVFSYLDMAAEIAKLHMLFEKCGIEKGDKISLIGRNNTRWCITYVATITYGAVIVPILQDFPANDLHHIINHSESKLLFCGDRIWDSVETDQIERVIAVINLVDFGCLFDRTEGESIREFQDNVQTHFKERYPAGFKTQDIKYCDVRNDDVIVLNYTSGTTGFSKGAMLTCNNITGNVQFCIDLGVRLKYDRVLSLLPLAHVYGCTVDFLLSLAVGAHVTLLGKTPSPKLLIEAMRNVKPQVVCCVPLILEKICRKQVFPILGKGFMRLALQIPLLDNKIYGRIRHDLINIFGGEVRQVIVGGAPFNHEVEEMLLKIKFPVTVAYGMTECAPLISYAHWYNFKPGSCGQVLHGYMQVKIDSSDPYNVPGEIMTRGENVMKGYYKNAKATEAIIDKDGWLHTGDIGTIDADGTLFIRGRCKSMVLGANGQNIYPEEIEAKLNNLYCVMESLVLERDGKLVALVYPDYERADADKVNGNLADVMKKNLEELNTLVAPYEKVSDIILFPNEFEKTPKKSIKRYLYNV